MLEKKGRMKWKLRGIHMNLQPVTGMRCCMKLLKLQVCVLSLVYEDIKSFFFSLPDNLRFNGVKVPCLTNIQSTKRYQ